MRIHRIALRNFRGVTSCDLTFAERGVTVVEGDNEVGKSSAAEALHLVLEYRDDSTARPVKAVRPLHLDAGAEVEVEISAGALRLTYAKRWHRDRFTRLKVTSPTPEVLNGREAHDRVRELLAPTVDLDLWRALSAPQGDALRQAALRDHPSLVAALDSAAGGDLGTAEESDLLARAEAEAARWFTATGRPKAALSELRQRAADAAAGVNACEQALARLEADIAWHADRQRAAEALAPKLAVATAAAEAARAHLAEVGRHHVDVEALSVAAQLAATRCSLAAGAVADRSAAVTAVATAGASLSDAAHRAREAAERVESAAAAALSAEGRLAVATEAATTAAAEADRTGAAHSRLRGVAALAEIEARLAEATRQRDALARAAAALEANPSTPEALQEVRAGHEAVVRAEAALAARRASVRIEALADVTVGVAGRESELAAGTATAHDVTDDLVVELPGLLRVTVAAGPDAQDRAVQLEQAIATLSARCAALGVTDLDDAQALEQERRDLASLVEASRAALAAAVAGTGIGELTALAAEARAVLVEDTGGGGPLVRVPTESDVAGARQRWDDACDRRRSAERALDLAEAGLAAARLTLAGAESARAAAASQVADARAQLETCEESLAEARAEADDAALVRALDRAEAAAAEAAGTWQEAAARLASLDLAGATQAAQRTAAERAGAEAALLQAREDVAGISSRLELQGEAGLHDRLAEAERTAAAADEELASVERKAAAARHLLDTLTRHRDEAARAYGAPLQREIETFGRLVFGDSFAVQLDDELRVAARVLDGLPVPWSELSVGAREQLAVLTRLAAATLVSPDGGVPVVFDDVLGFTDPGRLALVSAAFEGAGEHCQIIVLTCDPARYRHLARAETHCLTAPRSLGARQAG